MSASGGKSGSVLIVDDDRAIAMVLAQILTADGLDVETAADGQAALEKVQVQPYDVIVTDMRMPRLDGPGLYRALTERHPSLAARFIFITGDGLATETRRFLEQVRVPTLHKPFDITDLRRAVQETLAR